MSSASSGSAAARDSDPGWAETKLQISASVSLAAAAAAWIHAGGAHHTGFSLALTTEHLEDFAEMAGVEFLLIDQATELRSFKNEIRWNDSAYRIGG